MSRLFISSALLICGCAAQITSSPKIAPSPPSSPSPSPTTASATPGNPTTGPASPSPVSSFPALSFGLPPTPSAPNDYITVAQLNLWYFGPGCNGGFERYDCSGTRSTPLTPLLGATYTSADPAVVKQQIDWAHQYGVDAFSIEWTTPRDIPGSLEGTIDDVFLKSPDLPLMRWCIFDDFALRLMQTPGLNVDLSNGPNFDDPLVADTFVNDFDHFAKKYFGQAQYLKIDGRPVVYVWGTWNAIGGFRDAVRRARAAAAADGYDVFIVGDVIRTDQFIRQIAAAYDADTNFIFLIPGLAQAKNVGQEADSVDSALSVWESNIAGVKVDGRSDNVLLQPGFAPQFDNRLFDPNSSIYVPATSKDQVTRMATTVRRHTQPAGSEGWKLVWLNTWNNWAETTTIEPTVDNGPKYPAGNYGFDMVEVIRDVFGEVTFAP